MNLRKINIRDQKTQVGIILVIVAIASTFFGYTNIIEDKALEVETLCSQYDMKQGELNRIYAMKPQLAKLRKSVERMNIELDSLRSIFPDQKEVPKLIRQITKVANDAEIYTRKFDPVEPIVKEYYVENNYEMEVIGGYHQLATFFSHLSAFELIINLTKVNIDRNPNINRSIDDFEVHGGIVESIRARFTLTTFSSKK